MSPVKATPRAIIAAFTLLAGDDAGAATRFHLDIPASACQPDGKTGSKLTLVKGAWTLTSKTGSAILWCPVVHPYLDAQTAEAQVIDAFDLAYLDSDGADKPSSTWVTAQLFRRPVPGDALVPVSGVLSSNTSRATGNARLRLDVADHTLLPEPYFFKVVLWRSTPVGKVAFNGLAIRDDGI